MLGGKFNPISLNVNDEEIGPKSAEIERQAQIKYQNEITKLIRTISYIYHEIFTMDLPKKKHADKMARWLFVHVLFSCLFFF